MRRGRLIGTNLLIAAVAMTPLLAWGASTAHGGTLPPTFHAADAGPAAKPTTYDLPYLQMIGHRGGNDWAPENTLAGLAHSFQIGAQAVEFDVHFSSDQVPVVMHDETLNRTTNCTGAVEKYTYAQLRRCLSKRGQPVPNIYEALALVARAGGEAYVHVKQADTAAQARTIVAALNRYGLNDGRSTTTIADKTTILNRLTKAGAKRCGLIFSRPSYWRATYPVLIPFNTPITPALIARAQRTGHFVIAVQNRPIRVAGVPGLHLDGYMANTLGKALATLADKSRPPGDGSDKQSAARRAKDPGSGTAGA
jgi:glycerophosphoryl diester phosphodiesterase